MTASLRAKVECDGVWGETLLSNMSGLYAGECVNRHRNSMSSRDLTVEQIREHLRGQGWRTILLVDTTFDQCPRCCVLSPFPADITEPPAHATEVTP